VRRVTAGSVVEAGASFLKPGESGVGCKPSLSDCPLAHARKGPVYSIPHTAVERDLVPAVSKYLRPRPYFTPLRRSVTCTALIVVTVAVIGWST
jgi:hypothetical protein